MGGTGKLKFDWRECPRGDVTGQWAGMYVTLNAKGYIVLGKAAFRRMDEPAACLLLFDESNNRIGLKPTGKGIKNAFPVAKSGRHGGRMIRAYRMLQEFGLNIAETIQFQDAEVDPDGVLILDLQTARVSVRARAR